jgi:hypothetical protein
MKNGLHRIYLAEVASGILSGSCAMQEICATSRESFPQHRALASLSIGDYRLMWNFVDLKS